MGRQDRAPGSPNCCRNLYDKVVIAAKLEVQKKKKICTFNTALKAKSDTDLPVRRHWAGRNLTGGVGSREEKFEAQGNEGGSAWDLARKQGHPSQLRILLGAEDCILPLWFWGPWQSHTLHPLLSGLLFVPHSPVPNNSADWMRDLL